LFRICASALAALVVLAAGLVAGCGGDGGTSKHEFARSADEICADVTERVAQLNRTRPQSIPQVKRYIDQLKTAVRDKIDRLKALERPGGADGATAQRFTETLDREDTEQVLPTLNRLRQAVVHRDKKAFRAASKRLKAAQNEQSDQLAAQLGATRCVTS
jgi:hypothetical protein